MVIDIDDTFAVLLFVRVSLHLFASSRLFHFLHHVPTKLGEKQMMKGRATYWFGVSVEYGLTHQYADCLIDDRGTDSLH